jgi:hypothetical protein
LKSRRTLNTLPYSPNSPGGIQGLVLYATQLGLGSLKMTDELRRVPFKKNNHYKISTNSININAYTQHLMHQLKLFPVLLRQLEIGIGFTLKVRYFITIVRTLNETVNCLRKSISGYTRTQLRYTCCRTRIRSRKLNNDAHRVFTQYRS